jgi:hypothetical protein
LSGCSFVGNSGVGAGAVILAGAGATFDSCRFVKNHGYDRGGAISSSAYYYYDEAMQDYVSAPLGPVSLVNCLLSGNRAVNNYSELNMAGGATVTIRNATLTQGDSAGGNGLYLTGQATISNSIITGGVSLIYGASLSADSTCHPADWSSYGTGNITADPLLTPAGYLSASSPCINAGSSLFAPATDIDGVARPAGTGVDIGCQEFLDTDGDGIPDNVELTAGLDEDDATDPGLDTDGDGLANLAEYLGGTDLNAADTDGDGIADGVERAAGYNPAWPTRIIYVDGAAGADVNSGLTALLAKQTIGGAIAACQTVSFENVILVAAGTYSGAGNRDLDFNGFDIKLRSESGAAGTIIDLEGAGRFLSLSHAETLASWLDGFTVRNGYMASCGTAIHLTARPSTSATASSKTTTPADRFSPVQSGTGPTPTPRRRSMSRMRRWPSPAASSATTTPWGRTTRVPAANSAPATAAR